MMPLDNFSCVYRIGGASLFKGSQPYTLDDYHTLSVVGVDVLYKLSNDLEFLGSREEELAAQFGMSVRNIGLPQLQLSQLVHAESDALVGLIERDLKSGMSVYVHCILGVDRTGFVIGAFQQLVPVYDAHRNKRERKGTHALRP
jgi:protein-tyrosine phosphatase